MAKIDWVAALMEYMINEEMSYAKVAQKYGVSTRMVERVGAKEHWYTMRLHRWANVRYNLRIKTSNR